MDQYITDTNMISKNCLSEKIPEPPTLRRLAESLEAKSPIHDDVSGFLLVVVD
jgi:hypothetical protein